MIKKAGANVNQTNSHGETALMTYLASRDNLLSTKTIDMLIKAGFDCRITSNLENSVLHYACRNHSITASILEILVSSGAPIN